MSYAAVLFDFGGVLVPGPFDAFGTIERSAGVAAGAIREINSHDPDDNAWARIERGEVDADEFVRLFEAEARALGHELPGRRVLDVVFAPQSTHHAAYPVMIDALARCRTLGLRLGLITNNIRPLDESWVTDAFDVIVQSCLAGMRKPEPAIYARATNQLGVRIEDTVMLDDLGINLKPVRALGGTTIKVTSPEQAVNELFGLLAD